MMTSGSRTLVEPARAIPIVAEADVVVCGGGPGGFPAAIAAARRGARTVLIERHGYMGGMATAGLVAVMHAPTASQSETPIVEGILRELAERMHAIGGAPSWPEVCRQRDLRFDAEALKVVLDEMCLEAEVELLLHTLVVDAVTEQGAIKAVVIETKSGRQAVTGRVFVDATGDADVAYRAGAPTTHGRAFDGRCESMGSFFHLGGMQPVDGERMRELHEQIWGEMRNGRFHFYNVNHLLRRSFHRDHTTANMTRFAGNPDDARDMTLGELSVRRDMWELIRYLRANVPGFEDCYVQQSSPQIGPRESRQIVGPYALTGEDVRLGRKFADAVAHGSWWIDIHCPLGHTYPVHLCEVECPLGKACPFWAAEHERMYSHSQLCPPPGDWYDIPYRSLLSVGMRNLLSSGRCISATHEGMASSRVMGTCVAIGQAAGTAAALAAGQGIEPAQVDVAALRAALRAGGALV